MLGRLASGELTVGELAEPLSASLAAASKHVQVLERAGLISRTVAGRRHVCRPRPQPLATACAWLSFYETHWEQSLDALEDRLAPHHTPRRRDDHIHRRDPAATHDPRPAGARVPRLAGPDLVSRWMAAGDREVTRVEIDERVGGHYRIWQGTADGDIGGFEAELLELVPDRKIVWRWGLVGPDRQAAPGGRQNRHGLVDGARPARLGCRVT